MQIVTPVTPGVKSLTCKGVGIVEAVDPDVQGSLVGTCVVFVDTWNTWREQIVCQWQTCTRPRRPRPFRRRHLLHESFDCMGLDEVKSQSRGGRVAPAHGSCFQRREVGASISQTVSF